MRRNHLITATAVLSFGLTLTGCGTLYKLDVTAFNNPDHELGNSYVILSSTPNIDINSPEFQEYASQLERALAERDYRRVPVTDLDKAALAVYLSADISDPEKRFHSVSTALIEPAYDETTTSEARSANTGQSGGSQGQSSVKLPSIEPPPPEVLVGYEKQQFATTVYVKSLSIRAIALQQYARDVQTKGPDKAVPQEVWSVDVETTGQPDSLSEALPVMIAAAQSYFGIATGETVRLKLSEKDRRVQFIRGN